MRRRDEPIEVRQGLVGGGLVGGGLVGEGVTGLDELPGGLREGPSQFLWRNRLWRVLGIEARWVEAGAWWESPEADDLLCEQEVWRVEAASGMSFSRGVYELVHAWRDGSWRLRAVVD